MVRERFEGEIFGVGTTSGVRVVIGSWSRSRFGTFADAMVEAADGHRTLIAPSEQVADYVSTTYNFDSITITPVAVQRTATSMTVSSEPLQIVVAVGGRTLLGRLLHVIPKTVSTATWWATAIDPVVRVVMPGVRTRGAAGNNRREWYGASDMHAVTSVAGTFVGSDLGTLTDIDPPVRFGFASTPPRPSVVSVTSTIEIADV
jgi:hypothetical protein